MAGMLLPARSHAEPTPLPAGAVLASDPWNAVQIIRPEELAKLSIGPAPAAPMLLHVGFKPLFRGGAIPGSRYVGTGRTAEGIASLKRAVKSLPKNRNIVLHITKNLDTDWVEKGFPIGTPKH